MEQNTYHIKLKPFSTGVGLKGRPRQEKGWIRVPLIVYKLIYSLRWRNK